RVCPAFGGMLASPLNKIYLLCPEGAPSGRLGRKCHSIRRPAASPNVTCNAMRTFLIIISFLTLTFSCTNKTSQNGQPSENQKEKTSITSKNFSDADTLNKYIATDSLYDYGNRSFYVGRINNTDIGIVQLSDTSSVLYHKHGKSWEITDAFKY